MVDNVIAVGTRQQMLALGDATEEQLERADRTGTSDRLVRHGRWGGPGMFVLPDFRTDADAYHLPRQLFLEYAQLVLEGRDEEAEALLVPETYSEGKLP
ncbi:hypothetical protein [Streptomyces sp. 5-10]|uniref:hypothetical protein n=1 Tax=Streptomyces sp. 5-10 TaxID=878925 RepID=UPI00168ABE73|nr:hypothetical protein [Streptomyces sp. 5-10]MBD3004710.1 hypothetical protein [Streptomyces sp. 5-10]